jgi:hypothetical protein
MFRICFDPIMSRASFLARGSEIYAAFRWLEFSVYSAQGLPTGFLLSDGVEAYYEARKLVPARVFQ